MTEKNQAKAERKARRKEPIPFMRKTPTKREKMDKIEKKYRKGLDN